jgi:hypothetical protein
VKACSKCGRSKPLTEFYAMRGHPGRHWSQCRSCHQTRSKLYYQANRDRVQEQQKVYRVANDLSGHSRRLEKQLSAEPRKTLGECEGASPRGRRGWKPEGSKPVDPSPSKACQDGDVQTMSTEVVQ